MHAKDTIMHVVLRKLDMLQNLNMDIDILIILCKPIVCTQREKKGTPHTPS